MKYTTIEENIKRNLFLFAKEELENETEFLYDLFEFYPIEKMSTLFLLDEENNSQLHNTLNSFLEKHYLILDKREDEFIKKIDGQIHGSPLAIAISYLIKIRKELQDIIRNGNNIQQITLYYQRIIHSLNILITKYRGFAQFDITHKEKLDIYDKFTAFLISTRHNLDFLKECNETEKQAMEVFLDRCCIIDNDISYIARVPFELSQKGNIEVALIPSIEISFALSHYQLSLFEEIELKTPIKKDTILEEYKFTQNFYRFFKYINNKVTYDDILIFMCTIKNQMHEKYSAYERNRVRLLLNKSIAEYANSNQILCTVIIESLVFIGNKDNFYSILSEYFDENISHVSLSKSLLKYYVGSVENQKILLGKFGNIVKSFLNQDCIENLPKLS